MEIRIKICREELLRIIQAHLNDNMRVDVAMKDIRIFGGEARAPTLKELQQVVVDIDKHVV